MSLDLPPFRLAHCDSCDRGRRLAYLALQLAFGDAVDGANAGEPQLREEVPVAVLVEHQLRPLGLARTVRRRQREHRLTGVLIPDLDHPARADLLHRVAPGWQ